MYLQERIQGLMEREERILYHLLQWMADHQSKAKELWEGWDMIEMSKKTYILPKNDRSTKTIT